MVTSFHPWALQQFPCAITAPGLFLQFLPKNLHLVCVDMPGHEGTTRSALDDYSISGQAKRIHQVMPQHCIASAEGCRDMRDAKSHGPCLMRPRSLPSQAARATNLKLFC